MDQNDALCEYCAKLPFEPGLTSLLRGTYDGPESWPMGTFKEVRSRNCPFCTLLTSICGNWAEHAGSWRPVVPPGDSENITARWFSRGFDASYHSRPGSFVCLADNHQEENRLSARECLDPWINFEEVQRWVSLCRSEHDDCEGLDQSSLNFKEHRFRLIDVKENCIVEVSKSCTYVALSYVWGDPNDRRLLLLLGNRARLLQANSLGTAWSSIPATIRDAITATKKLGQRYLWVDSLCLVQDDPDELRDCVTLMDRIYQEAIFTIVAASGQDAHAGLSGVTPTTRNTQRLVKEIIPGLRMTTIQDLDSWLRPSKYSQRGWT